MRKRRIAEQRIDEEKRAEKKMSLIARHPELALMSDFQKTVLDNDVELYNDDSKVRSRLLVSAREGLKVRLQIDLINGAAEQINCKDRYGATPLSLASTNGHAEVVEILLREQGIEVNASDDEGYTPLLKAIQNARDEVVNVLVKHKDVDINHKYYNGSTALHEACGAGYCSVVDILLNIPDIDVNATDAEGITPLLQAIQSNHEEVVKKLIANDAVDVNLADKKGNTPLTLAADKWRMTGSKTAEILLEHPNIRNDINSPNGEHKNKDMVMLLAFTDLQSCEKLARENNHKQISQHFKSLMQVNLKLISSQWETERKVDFLKHYLILATEKKKPEVVRFLLHEIELEKKESLHKVLLYCDRNHEIKTFQRTALQRGIQNMDNYCIAEILLKERECHNNKEEAVLCLKHEHKLTNDEHLTKVIDDLGKLFDKTGKQKVALGVLAILPAFMKIASYIYDIITDSYLSVEYHDKSSFNNDTATTLATTRIGFDNDTKSSTTKSNFSYDALSTTSSLTPENYSAAFIANASFIIVTYLSIVLMTLCSQRISSSLYKHMKAKNQGICFWVARILFSLFAPITIPFANLIFKFQHKVAARKTRKLDTLEDFEYICAILYATEAGLESSCQVVLQTWLLASNFKTLPNFPGLLRGIFFIFFTDASEVEKSFGKIIISIFGLVRSVGGCYTLQKRGAVVTKIPMYISLLAQIMARIISFGLFFCAVRDFEVWFPILYLLHFGVVLAIKMIFLCRRDRLGVYHNQGHSTKVIIVSTVASSLFSSLVYSNIKFKQRLETKIQNVDEVDNPSQQHAADGAQNTEFGQNGYNYKIDEKEINSTFKEQVCFFVLVLMENVILAAIPLIMGYKEGSTIFRRISQHSHVRLTLIVIGLSVVSWCSNLVFYKFWGHTWRAINGPRAYKRLVEVIHVPLLYISLPLTWIWTSCGNVQTP